MRGEFVRNHPLANPEIAMQVLELLEALESSPTFLSHSFLESIASLEPIYAIGEHIAGRYELTELLSLSTSSEVYKAVDLRLSRNPVVVKFNSGVTDASRVSTISIEREIHSLARLNSSSIAGPIDYGFHRGVPYLVTQYLPGLRLDQWIEQIHPSFDLRLRAFQHLLRIVRLIHDHGLLHLDLKPANILVTGGPAEDPVVQIVDFGIAAFEDQQHIAAAGTPIFTAPERMQNIATPASDIYSLARLGLYLLPDAPPACRAIFATGLESDPALRPQSAAQLQQQFHAALRPVWLLRNKLLFAAACLALLATGAYTWFRITPASKPPIADPPLHQVSSMRGTESQPCFSPDGNTVYFNHTFGRENALYGTSFQGGIPRLVIAAEPGYSVSDCAVSPTGKSIAYISTALQPNSIQIRLLQLATRQQTTLYTGRPDSLIFHPTLNYLYFSESTDDFPFGALRRIHLGTGTIEPLPNPTPGIAGDNDFTIAPDGRSIVIARYATRETSDLYLHDLDSDGVPSKSSRRLTNMSIRVKRPHWHPSGNQLYFTAGPLTNMTLYALTLDENRNPGTPRQITGWKDRLRYPAIALRAPHIAFTQDREECDIFALDIASGRLSHVISSTTLEEEARFSPDGKSIAFLSERSGSLQAFIGDPDPEVQPTQVSDWVSAEKAWSAWDPSGRAHWYARTPTTGQILMTRNTDGKVQTRPFPIQNGEEILGLSADGNSFFAQTRQPNGYQVERIHFEGGKRETLTTAPAFFIREFAGPAGAPPVLLYAHQRGSEGLFVLSNGQSRLIYPALSRRNTFTYYKGDVYLIAPTPRLGLYKVNLASGASTLISPLDKTPGWGLDVSPDGKTILLSLFDFADSNILGATLP